MIYTIYRFMVFCVLRFRKDGRVAYWVKLHNIDLESRLYIV